ncbi:unnamed protein product (macronuclear) [Paramecium tetraurelia]|uniref:Transmembrane protein n=1 Tax=Paramecium tetraurelia TaxID=5888 RepID=A0EI91_PARTE|nr:uncharacterized protein GSPATT00027361001 [Paramecium tetraurelia]CAK95032.1 unnamed protein product [Paramecium tetraurelia]|eukprot:XP_001462405.1 hypothetical protein (macronuclear) [Paramecium tetraurelia strain d4-2]
MNKNQEKPSSMQDKERMIEPLCKPNYKQKTITMLLKLICTIELCLNTTKKLKQVSRLQVYSLNPVSNHMLNQKQEFDQQLHYIHKSISLSKFLFIFVQCIQFTYIGIYMQICFLLQEECLI